MDVEWLVDCEPREVQLEALRRSYYGYKLKDSKDDHPHRRPLYLPRDPSVVRKGTLRGWGHFLEMRLGKTPLLLAEHKLFVKDGRAEALVVLSPSDYKEDWGAEAEKFGVNQPIFVVDTSKIPKIRNTILSSKTPPVVVFNHEAVRSGNSVKLIQEILKKWKTGVAIDESIVLKSASTNITRESIEFGKHAAYVRCLTGLPMVQSPADFYGQLRTMGHQSGVNYYQFRNTYCKMGGFKKKQIVSTRNDDKLRDELSRVCFWAKRRDWSETVNPEYYRVGYDMCAEQRLQYQAMLDQYVTQLENGDIISVEQAITAAMKRQQVTSGFMYNEDRVAVPLVPLADNPKLQRLKRFVETESSNKPVVIVFHYAPTGDMLSELFSAHHPCIIRSKSRMASMGVNILEEKHRFNRRETKLAIINSAAKYGHDLSGYAGLERTECMVFAENSYSLDTRFQIENRIQAANQNWSSLYFDLAGSPEEHKIVDALQHKEGLVDAVLGKYRNKMLHSEYDERWAGEVSDEYIVG